MQTLLRARRSLTARPVRRIVSMIGAGLGVVAWFTLAPTTLGGSSTYVTTYGTSMEPTLERGDLAIVRDRSTYRVGDVVAYHSDSLDTIVLHRIIARDGDQFVLKGDDNTWTDTDRPTATAIIGKLDITVPGFGNHIQRAASPAGLASLAAIAALPVARRGLRRRRNVDASAQRPVNPARDRSTWRHIHPQLLVPTAVAIGLLLFAWTRPTTTVTTEDLPFDERGEFTYTGPAPGGLAVYQADQVSSGQPVFLSLVDRVDLAFAYRASSTAPVLAEGDISLSGMVMDAGGWTYRLDLGDPAHFEGSEASSNATLDLRDLRATIAGMQSATGVTRDAYTVRIDALVNREVRHNDAVSAGKFAASLEFTLDDLEMRLTAPEGDTLTPSQGGLLSSPVDRPGEIRVLGQSLSVAALRALALALALIIAALWIDSLYQTSRADEAGLIERRYRNYLLPVRTAQLTAGVVIDVETVAALARIADHTGAPILRVEDGGYYVIDGTRAYRYTVDRVGTGPMEPAGGPVPPSAPVASTNGDSASDHLQRRA